MSRPGFDTVLRLIHLMVEDMLSTNEGPGSGPGVPNPEVGGGGSGSQQQQRARAAPPPAKEQTRFFRDL